MLTVSGLAKSFVVPGWRVGWVLIHDPAALLGEVRAVLQNLSQLIIGACTLVQSPIPLLFGNDTKTGA